MFSVANTDNNNNRNVPTACEVARNLPNFHRTSSNNLYCKHANLIIDRLVKENNTIVLVYETCIEDDGWIDTYFEPYEFEYTLHVFYKSSDDILHHKMYTRMENTQYADHVREALFPYTESPVVDFDYNTLRKFHFPQLEFPLSNI